jgi:hypothetical protein
MHPRKTLLCLALSAANLNGCSDDATKATSPGPSPIASTTPSVHLMGEERFDLDLKIAGIPRPNEPLKVHAVAQGLLNTADAELAIYFPESDAAQRGGWQRLVTLPGQRIPAAATQRGPTATGVVLLADATFNVPVRGYYRVLAVVRKRSAEGDVAADGHIIQPSVYKELWVYADSIGGKITDTFDPTVRPDTVVGRPGPSRVRGRRSAGMNQLAASANRA